MKNGSARKSVFGTAFKLLKITTQEWLNDKAPQLGAALAYYTVFSLAPLILVLLAIIGVVFRDNPADAWHQLTEQMSYFLDKSAVQVVQNIAAKASQPGKSTLATIIGIALALFGASGIFGQLQDALNTIWGVKAKPGLGIWRFLRTRFLSFAMVAGVCFLLLVSLAIEALLKGFSHYIQGVLPGGLVIAVSVYLIFDFAVSTTLFAMIFKILPDVKTRWNDVWIGAAMTAVFFLIGKWALGLYLGSGAAASAYGAASSLITLLLWIYYSSQILLFGAEFTQVYASEFGSPIKPDKYAVKVERKEAELPPQEYRKRKARSALGLTDEYPKALGRWRSPSGDSCLFRRHIRDFADKPSTFAERLMPEKISICTAVHQTNISPHCCWSMSSTTLILIATHKINTPIPISRLALPALTGLL
jgi:membrane protein